MPVFTKRECNILFIHIPKCAGSTVEKISAKLGWSESFSVRGKRLSDIKYYKASLQHLHAKALMTIFDPNYFDATFTIVRNPYARLKSEYYWQKYKGITEKPAPLWIEETLKLYKTNNYLYDNHIRPQHEFLIDSAEIFKLEEDGIEKAKKLLERHDKKIATLSLKNLKSKFSQNKKEKEMQKNMTVEEQFIKHYRIIRDFYGKDYEKFSYVE